MLLSLFGYIALISLTVLIPTYYFGTDASWNTNYLTFWSKITIPHLDMGSVSNIVPVGVVVVMTYATMQFYSLFTQVYVFFRQRCMRRVIPQNYAVLL